MLDNEIEKQILMVEKETKLEARLLWIDLVLGDLKTTLSEIQHNYSTALKQNETNLATKHAFRLYREQFKWLSKTIIWLYILSVIYSKDEKNHTINSNWFWQLYFNNIFIVILNYYSL